MREEGCLFPSDKGFGQPEETLGFDRAAREECSELVTAQEADGFVGTFAKAIQGGPTMKRAASPALREPVKKQAEVVRLYGEPLVGGLTINVGSKAKQFAGKLPLSLRASDMLNGRVGEGQVESLIGKVGMAAVALEHLEVAAERRFRLGDVQ